MESEKEFLTVKEFADLLNIHPNTVRRSIKSGRISAFKIGSGKRSDYRIPRAEINRMCVVDLEKIIEKVIESRRFIQNRGDQKNQ